jgi:hypothetical protein
LTKVAGRLRKGINNVGKVWLLNEKTPAADTLIASTFTLSIQAIYNEQHRRWPLCGQRIKHSRCVSNLLFLMTPNRVGLRSVMTSHKRSGSQTNGKCLGKRTKERNRQDYVCCINSFFVAVLWYRQTPVASIGSVLRGKGRSF